jgi:GAF domain-containing protein
MFGVESVSGTLPVYRVDQALDDSQLASIREYEHVVLVFGPEATARGVMAALDQLASQAPRTRCSSIVLSAPEQLADFQPLVTADRLFYLAAGDLPERQLAALIEGARGINGRDGAIDLSLPVDDLRRIALAENVAEVAGAVERSIGTVVEARRSRCVLFDREEDVLWTPGEGGEESSAAAGLVSFVLRTGMSVCLARMAGDPRADLDLDNPDGVSSDRFLGVPVRAPRGAIVAVIVALRPQQDAPFEPRDVATLEALAAHVSPYLAAWLVQSPGSPFRYHALRNLDQPLLTGPEPLHLKPLWTRGTPWLVAVTFAAFVLALLFVVGLHHG